MAEKKGSKGEEIKFEKAINDLEKIVEFLESDDVPLDEALKKYEEGIRLSRLLSQLLTQAEKKIEVLTRTLEGELKAEPFAPEEISAKPGRKTALNVPADDAKGEESLF